MEDRIVVRGARQHNLKNIDVIIPKGKLVVITGVSGSGKSSLAFDTIYAEGYRRYVESLSSYARQFLELTDKPDVDFIYGLTPSIAIDQKAVSKNPRSTVATVTEIYDYLRVLFARVGDPVCPNCNVIIKGQTVQEMVDTILSWQRGTKAIILAPLVEGRKGEYRELFQRLAREGFVRVRINGEIRRLDEQIHLDKNKRHTIDLVIDRIKVDSRERQRITESVELALKKGDGKCKVLKEKEEIIFSEKFSCPYCGFALHEVSPRLFSFNSPYGACVSCQGLGKKREVDPMLAINQQLSIKEGAIVPWRDNEYMMSNLLDLCSYIGIPVDKPFKNIEKWQKDIIVYGIHDGGYSYEGLLRWLERRIRESEEDSWYFNFVRETVCSDCKGSRLRKEALCVKICGKSIWDIVKLTVEEALSFFKNIELEGIKRKIAKKLLEEIEHRLNFLKEVGLGYITLDRESSTLSGGEAQRIRLATQIGSALTGVTYVLDEPTIGLHPRDTEKLIENLKRLRDIGNTVIVVEHDRDVIEAADYIVDLGPGAGEYGGHVVYSGGVKDIKECHDSITGAYLSGRISIEVPKNRRASKGFITLKNVRHRNLKGIDVTFPLGCFICVTGVSGSGKSSLVVEVLYPAVYNMINRTTLPVGASDGLEVRGDIDKVILVDQSPIGRTPRSNPATYVGFFTYIRELFASVPESRARGYNPGRFSFNVKGGRCEACRGEGYIKVEMHFLPDVYVKCESCGGFRYNRETLEITYKGKNISEVLNMSVDEAFVFFEHIPKIASKLKILKDVGLGYLKLGQPATTLSGGEAQRIKLARELARRATGSTLYIMDEPTVGLHMDDVKKLIDVINRLVDRGNTVVVIEHNLDVIKCADYVIDLGPEGGDMGGWVVAEGTPEEVAQCEKSHTARFLKLTLPSQRVIVAG